MVRAASKARSRWSAARPAPQPLRRAHSSPSPVALVTTAIRPKREEQHPAIRCSRTEVGVRGRIIGTAFGRIAAPRFAVVDVGECADALEKLVFEFRSITRCEPGGPAEGRPGMVRRGAGCRDSSRPDSVRKVARSTSPYDRSSAAICCQRFATWTVMLSSTIVCVCLSSTIWQPDGRNGKSSLDLAFQSPPGEAGQGTERWSKRNSLRW